MKGNSYDFDNLFTFLRNTEKLKTELRHGWTNDPKRQESVAEHTWMTSLLGLILADKLQYKVDQGKVLKMIIIHDLVEVFAGDIPAHEISKRKEEKVENEREALQRLTSTLEKDMADEIVSLWEEFEKAETNEARFAYALDKFECLVQHNISDISTWDEGDYRYTFIDKQDTPFNFDDFMRELKDNLDVWTFDKLKAGGSVDRIPKENQVLFQENQNRRKLD